ncbi:hypothetical protein GCM10027517_15890 [Phycicoccus ginsengisoli]
MLAQPSLRPGRAAGRLATVDGLGQHGHPTGSDPGSDLVDEGQEGPEVHPLRGPELLTDPVEGRARVLERLPALEKCHAP